MGKSALCLLLATAAFAQKKPITVDVVNDLPADRGRVSATWSPDGKSFVFKQQGELMLYSAASHSARKILTLDALQKAASRSGPGPQPFDWTDRHARTESVQWFPDGKSLLYPTGGDLFLVHLDSAKWEQITKSPEPEVDPQLAPDGRKIAFRRGWDLYTLDLQTRQETRLTSGGSETLRNGALDWVYPEEIGIEAAFWWSPDSQSIAFLQFDISQEPVVPHEDLLGLRAVYEPERYPQAGEKNATVRIGILPAAGGTPRWVDLGDTRDVYLIARIGWLPDSRSIYALRTNRVQDQLEAFAIDAQTLERRTLFRESDRYWINLHGDLEFLKDGRHFLWTSEREGGYRHIFLHSLDGKEPRQLTRGAWQVTDIAGVDEAHNRVFYVSTEPSHLERQLYSIALDGTDKRRITREEGTHDISMGPGAAYYVDTFSSLTTPPRSTVYTAGGESLTVLREPGPRQTGYDVLIPETVQFRGPDGTMLYGSIIKPPGFQPGRKYPVVVSVYGGPDAILPVRDKWPDINIDQALAHKGYLIWQAENRGGAGRGHAFETSIHHKLGVNELADQVAGIRYLISLGYADPGRIGIHGWSYGGFMTINAMLNAPDVFRSGFAGAPVTSWLNYDTIYTERYMGLPKDNPTGYKDTALPQNAAKLKGKLAIAHNIEDDNVLFQNTLQMTTALESAGKLFEFLLYPQKSHHVSGPESRQLNYALADFFDRTLK